MHESLLFLLLNKVWIVIWFCCFLYSVRNTLFLGVFYFAKLKNITVNIPININKERIYILIAYAVVCTIFVSKIGL